MPAKQKITVTKTITRQRTKKSSKPSKSQKRCPTCGKYMK